jgi:hypothetical protein
MKADDGTQCNDILALMSIPIMSVGQTNQRYESKGPQLSWNFRLRKEQGEPLSIGMLMPSPRALQLKSYIKKSQVQSGPKIDSNGQVKAFHSQLLQLIILRIFSTRNMHTER